MATDKNEKSAKPVTVKQHKPINRPRMDRVTPRASDVLDLLEQIRNHGDRIAYRYYVGKEIKDLTYGEFYTMVDQCAAAFDAMGLKGQRVAVIGDTSPQWICTYLATLAAGCVAVPMDKELEVSEICKFLDIVEAKAIVYSKSFNEKFVDAIQNNKTGVEYFIPVTPAYDNTFDSKVISFEQVQSLGRERIERTGYTFPPVTNREELAEMLFTSGTTGTSKCVMLSQKNIFAAVNAACETVCFYPDDVIMSVLPVHHTYELMCIVAAALFGMKVCINDSLRHVLKNLQVFQPTGLVLVPLFLNTMYKKIWAEAERTGKDKVLKAALATSKTLLSMGIDVRRKLFKTVLDSFGGRLDHIICGGAKLNPDLIAAFEDFGISVFEGFGITECSPLTNVTPYYNRKYGSIGPSVPCCRSRIADAQPGEHGYMEGELQIKGDNVMMGYYNNPEANATAFTEDGWFRTGDVAYKDEDGYVYITGRMKSVIVLENGKNVFPEEIEEYLDEIEAIAECVVIGRKAKDSDEVILTVVAYPNYEKLPAGATEELIHETIYKQIMQINRRLPSFKQMKALELRSTEFEKTTSKKIKRHLVK
ncbi:MAG: AMP-binding protein [Clostridia bacterium]|nr:AMP-binding protein [Clostridia bacterium]